MGPAADPRSTRDRRSKADAVASRSSMKTTGSRPFARVFLVRGGQIPNVCVDTLTRGEGPEVELRTTEGPQAGPHRDARRCSGVRCSRHFADTWSDQPTGT